MAKIALITGITGQDGSFLAEFLIEKGYEVHGIMRRSSSFNTGRIEHLYLSAKGNGLTVIALIGDMPSVVDGEAVAEGAFHAPMICMPFHGAPVT